MTRKILSIIVPIYNEEENIPFLIKTLTDFINKNDKYAFEVVLVNDGSKDNSLIRIQEGTKKNKSFKIIDFSRNFGKEIAMTAGINKCKGDACIVFDADLQYPIEKIPEFIEKWEKGAEVVMGIREQNSSEGVIKRVGSFFFYKIMNFFSNGAVIKRATDFTLIDRKVIDEFNKIEERDRNTRALIMWLGFRREYIYFTANSRMYGKASYDFKKLVKLALDSFISLSMFPLKLAGYLGVFITFLSAGFSVVFFIGKYVFRNWWFWSISGTAQLAVLLIFLIGIVLICLGLMALYIGKITNEQSKRPLYVVRN